MIAFLLQLLCLKDLEYLERPALVGTIGAGGVVAVASDLYWRVFYFLQGL